VSACDFVCVCVRLCARACKWKGGSKGRQKASEERETYVCIYAWEQKEQTNSERRERKVLTYICIHTKEEERKESGGRNWKAGTRTNNN